jgi:16S rRNA (guanine966-N2)-methyltransferase
VREALFSIWAPRMAGARFLDLFAGSGAVSFEAAGRGAGHVLAIEGEAKSAANLQRVVRSLRAAVEVRRAQLPGELGAALKTSGRFDLVFVDPPYGSGCLAETLERLAPFVESGGAVAVEMSVRSPAPEAPAEMEPIGERRYGETVLRFYRRK